MADNGTPSEAPAPVEHLNIKVTDNNNEVFFKIKRSTQLKKLMDAFCERQGKQLSTVRFLFDGTRVRPEDTPDSVCAAFLCVCRLRKHRLMTRFNTARHGRWRYSGGAPGADWRLDRVLWEHPIQ
jgi:small ubiquitin-related modifier